MRNVSLFALAISGLMLAGCSGSPDGPGVFMSDASLDLCGVNCPDRPDEDPPDPVDPVDPPDDGDNVAPDPGGSTIVEGPNTYKAIALEKGKLVSPHDPVSPQNGGAVSTLTRTPDNPATPNIDESTATYAIDTKGATNKYWPQQRTIGEYIGGTNQPNFHGTPVNLGAGYTGYKEYADQDTVLQVWEFGHSTASYFRVKTDGEPTHKAFAFGGTKTATTAMPTGGTATYRGFYGSNGTASNWEPEESDVDGIVIVEPNMEFSSNGSATLTANFADRSMIGSLSPQHWSWYEGGEWNYDVATDTLYSPKGITTGNRTEHIVPGYFVANIGIRATITGNEYNGVATLGSSAILNTQNPVYGAFFGTTLNQTTGVFSVAGELPYPRGGEFPNIGDRAGFVTHSGIFSANCVGGAGSACAP